jgi:hypothetical protein
VKLSIYLVVALVVFAYYYGRNQALNDVATGTAAKVGAALTPGQALADALEPLEPGVAATNANGTSAWAP